jgi:hypothetical protein
MVHERMNVALPGRGAEELCPGSISSGAATDLEVATSLARDAVIRLGFSPRARGTVPTEGWVSSEGRRHRIDEEVDRLISDSHDAATELLLDHRAELEALAAALLREGGLDRPALEAILGTVPARPPDPIEAVVQGRPVAASEPVARRAGPRPAIAAAAAALRAWRAETRRRSVDAPMPSHAERVTMQRQSRGTDTPTCSPGRQQ